MSDLNATINHADRRAARMAELIREEMGRGRYTNLEVVRRLSEAQDRWADVRDRAIDDLVDEHQADLDDWSSRYYRG